MGGNRVGQLHETITGSGGNAVQMSGVQKYVRLCIVTVLVYHWLLIRLLCEASIPSILMIHCQIHCSLCAVNLERFLIPK